jgi:hypothetical protein
MEITFEKYNSNTYIDINCKHSTAVSDVTVIVDDSDNVHVLVDFKSGDSWGYIVPAHVILANLGEESVGRFVASVIKPNATYAMNFKRALATA